MTKRILILNGHPAAQSLSRHFAETYAEAARNAGAEVKLLHLSDLHFDADFGFAGYRQTKQLEPDLEHVLELFTWCEHLVLTSPMWWGGIPAKLKGLFDRVLLPGRTFDTRVIRNGFPTPMLSGRSARVLLTSDTPDWFFRTVYRGALWVQLKHQILGFVGFKPAQLSHFSTTKEADARQIAGWTDKVSKLGETHQ